MDALRPMSAISAVRLSSVAALQAPNVEGWPALPSRAAKIGWRAKAPLRANGTDFLLVTRGEISHSGRTKHSGLVVYPQFSSTDLNDLICKMDLNLTMASIQRSCHHEPEGVKKLEDLRNERVLRLCLSSFEVSGTLEEALYCTGQG
jgi:hypothetical protein